MKYLYKNAVHERETYWQYRNEFKNSVDFKEKYNALISGLDDESISCVDTIISRLQLLFTTTSDELDVFTPKENLTFMELKNNFYPSIIRKNDGVYDFNGNLLPRNYFDTLIYYHGFNFSWFNNHDIIKNGNILDIGAFIGDSTLFFSKLTNGQVYAWDAIKENCNSIEQTISLNHLSNVEVYTYAVGETSKKGFISKNDRLNWSTMYPYGSRSYIKDRVTIRSIDDFINEQNLNVALIKLHVEGAEFGAVKGSKHTLTEQKPALIISIYHNPTDFWMIKPYIESLKLGYRFKIFKPVNGNIMGGTILLAEAN